MGDDSAIIPLTIGTFVTSAHDFSPMKLLRGIFSIDMALTSSTQNLTP
ncbi:hypothetical protein [Brasilonema sp. UFV-L1]|nr:hypothetical protein [Brasilonema sp. UFV-L1]